MKLLACTNSDFTARKRTFKERCLTAFEVSDFLIVSFSGTSFVWLRESRCSKKEIHDSCPNSHKYAIKWSSFPLDEGMDRYLRIGMNLVEVRDRSGEMSHFDPLCAGARSAVSANFASARLWAIAN